MLLTRRDWYTKRLEVLCGETPLPERANIFDVGWSQPGHCQGWIATAILLLLSYQRNCGVRPSAVPVALQRQSDRNFRLRHRRQYCWQRLQRILVAPFQKRIGQKWQGPE